MLKFDTIIKTEDVKKNGGEDFIVRIRGLPWSAKESEVKEFFAACDEIKAVHFTFTKEGRPTGEAYLELGSSRDVDLALLKHKEHLKNRYIEVFIAKKGEMEFVLRRNSAKAPADNSSIMDNVVRLRGLPFGSTTQDIEEFFTGLEIAPEGIVRPTDKTGRVTGEAYVKFLDKETTERALDKHMQEIGNRYIEVFRSTEGEFYIGKYPNGGGPNDDLYFTAGAFGGDAYGRKRLRGSNPGGIPSLLDDIDLFENADMQGGGFKSEGGMNSMAGGASDKSKNYIGMATGHMLHMRGIPFKATATDIVEFFKPTKVLNILVLFDENTGKCLGEADVEFLSHTDAVEAMKKDKQHMGERYVDLFLNSVPDAPEPLIDPTSNDFLTNNGGFQAPDAAGNMVSYMPYDPNTGMVQYPGHYPPGYPFGYSQYPPSYY